MLLLFGWIVPGHESSLAFGLLGGEDGIPVVAMLGRVQHLFLFLYSTLNMFSKFHPYEGHALSAVVFPVRVMAKLGVKDLISELPIFILFYLRLLRYMSSHQRCRISKS